MEHRPRDKTQNYNTQVETTLDTFTFDIKNLIHLKKNDLDNSKIYSVKDTIKGMKHKP